MEAWEFAWIGLDGLVSEGAEGAEREEEWRVAPVVVLFDVGSDGVDEEVVGSKEEEAEAGVRRVLRRNAVFLRTEISESIEKRASASQLRFIRDRR